MLFGFVALMFAFTGAGRYAIDALIRPPVPARDGTAGETLRTP